MATTPTQNPQYLWRFWSCQKRRFHTVYATSEKEARALLPDAPCLFAAKVHVTGGDQ